MTNLKFSTMGFYELILFIAGTIILLAFAWGFTLNDECKNLKRGIDVLKKQCENDFMKIRSLESENAAYRETIQGLRESFRTQRKRISELNEIIHSKPSEE
jgi:predicted  nucleic acid-binding Zn-ribbon protein